MTKTRTLRYNTRLLKAGALLEETRSLVRSWDEKKDLFSLSALVSQGLLDKTSRSREQDILKRAFIPRFVKGKPVRAWKVVHALENQNVPLEILKPVYYWITARNEPVLYDFVCEELITLNKSGATFILKDEVIRWLREKLDEQGIVWSPTVIKGMAGKILSVLRDFGVLQGKVKKRMAHSFYLPVEAFAYIAFCLYKESNSGAKLVRHPDWKLFLLEHEGIERMFLEADRQKMLRYFAAGKIIRIDFPAQTHEEMAHVISRTTP